MVSFTKTMSFLEGQRRSSFRPLLAAVAVLLVGWSVWLALGESAVYAVSENGRLVAAGAPTPIQSQVAGLVEATNLVLGAEVRSGDVLVELDSSAQRLRRKQTEAELIGLVAAQESLERIVAVATALVESTKRVGATRVHSEAARASVASELAKLAKQQDDAMKKLRESSLATGLDVLKASEDAKRQHGEAAIRRVDTALASADQERVLRESEMRVLTLTKDLREIRTRVETTRALLAELDWEIERRTIRSPVDGTIADVGTYPRGSVVTSNLVLGTIVQRTKMRWVAYFAANDAVGRVKVGQNARIRLDAFPWTAYGALEAVVTSAGTEARENGVRVELEVVEERPDIPLSHGMTGATDVRVETIAPIRLLLRLAGERATPRATAPRASARGENAWEQGR